MAPRAKRAVADDEEQEDSFSAFTSTLSGLLLDLQEMQDDTEERALTTAFVKLPSKKLYPDYYVLIDLPISLSEIQKKLAKGLYTTSELFIDDFTLMYQNALKYNDPTSWIVDDANAILSYITQMLENVKDPESAQSPDLYKLCLNLLDEVISYDFPSEGELSGPFIADVDPEEYPEYFSIIENPTSFDNVKRQLKSSILLPERSIAENLDSLYDATTLIFKNAQAYNDPSSLIHEDLKKLQVIFDQKFEALKNSLVPESSTLKLKLNPPKDPLKFKLSLKAKSVPVEDTTDDSVPKSDEPSKKKRGRKPKKVKEDEEKAAALETRMKRESEGLPEPEEDGSANEELDGVGNSPEMGKSSLVPSNDTVFLRRASFATSLNVVNRVISEISLHPFTPLPAAKVPRSALFPEVPLMNAATLFEYNFDTLGFSSKSYSLTLPQDASPLVTLKVYLHELILSLKRDDLLDANGPLKVKSEEDFICTVYHNDVEIFEGGEMSEEKDLNDQEVSQLGVSYDLKMNYGLNVITFELRLAPNLAKILKKKKSTQNSEFGGRHTRHQLQQLKLNWEVERFSLYVFSGAA